MYLSELSLNESVDIINGLRFAAEQALVLHKADPANGDGYWMGRAQAFYAAYRKLGGAFRMSELIENKYPSR